MLVRQQHQRLGKVLRVVLPRGLLLTGLGTLLLASAVPGPVFHVNTFTQDTQRDPAVAMNASGTFVVAWTSFGQDGDGAGVFAQRYDANGTRQGTEFPVNTITLGEQRNAAAAMDAHGSFVIAWAAPTGTFDDIFARRFDPNGNPRDAIEFKVNTTTVGQRFQTRPAVGMDAQGNFVIAWATTTDQIFAQRYDAGGARHGEFQVNAATVASRFTPAVGMDAAGNFVVAWLSDQGGTSLGVFGRRYDPAGAPQGSEFQVDTTLGAGNSNDPTVGMRAAGDFLVAWVSNHSQVFARAFRPDGTDQAFPVSSISSQSSRLPKVGMDAAGNFLFTWDTLDQNDAAAIFARHFGADLTPQEVESQVDTAPSQDGDATNNAVGMDAAGNFVVAWDARGDGDATGVFGRRFAVPSAVSALSIDDVTVVEGDSGTTNATFSVTLSPPSDQAVTVDFFSADGTAGAALTGADYQANSGPLTFAPGETRRPIAVRVNGDTLSEPDETFLVNLTNASANATIAKGQGVGTILNDDNTLSINDVTLSEGASGTKEAVFTVSLSAGSSHPIGVHFSTSNGTAAGGADYVVRSGQVTFDPGDTTRDIHIVINGDILFEPDETFFVDLSSPTNAAIARAQGVGTIVNDDFASGIAGSQFLVNSTVSGFQFQAAVGRNAAGASVVAWSSEIPGDGEGIFAQRFNADGTRAGLEFRVDDATGVCAYFPRRREPAVGMDADGGFVIVWTTAAFNISGTQFDEDYAFSDVCAQRYRDDGAPLGGNFQVDTNLNHTGHAQSPDVGMTGDGDFVVAWSGQGPRAGRPRAIFAKRFDANGVPQGSTNLSGICNNAFTGAIEPCDILVNVTTNALDGLHPSVAVDPSVPACPFPPCVITPADFYIAWDNTDIFMRGFDGGNGQPLGNEFLVNTYRDNPQERPRARMDDDGNIVVIWQGEGDGGQRGIFGQRFGPPTGPCPPGVVCGGSFGPKGSQFEVFAQQGSLGFVRAGLAVSAQGTFVVTWNNFESDTGANHAIFARFFAAAGTPRGDLFQVSDVGSTYFRPAAGMDSSGSFLIAWEGGNDGSASGIFARRFTIPTLSINNVSVAEGDSGTTNVTFTVTLSGAGSQTVSVIFATADGTATLADNDYLQRSDTLTFHPGQPTTQQVTIAAGGDTIGEPDETFFVDLSHATNAVIAKARGVGTILNDDGADLSLTKTGSPDPLGLGSDLTYTIVVTNNGPKPATGVILTDPLTATMTHVSSSATQGSCSGTSTVTCSLGTLASGAQATVRIVVRPTVAGSAGNTAAVTGDQHDPNPANNRSRAETRVVCTTCPELEIAAIEVTQGVQFFGDPDQASFPDNSVPLIQNKATVVRVYFKTSASVISPGQFKRITGELSGFNCGATTPFGTVRPNNVSQYPEDSNISISSQRTALTSTLNFLLPRDYTRLCTDYLVSISSPDSSVVSTLKLTGLKFEDVPATKVRLYNLQIPLTNAEPRPIDRMLLPVWLARGYPISDLIFEETWYSMLFTQDCWAVDIDLTVLKWFNIIGGEDARFKYYGMRNDESGFMRGCSIGGPVASGPTGIPSGDFSWDRDGSYGDWYGAHELGHTFGRSHVNATGEEAGPDPNYPYAGGVIGPPSGSLQGLDLRGSAQSNPALIPSTWFDIMSYGSSPGQWVSDYTYKGLRDIFVQEGGAAAGSGAPGGTPGEYLGVLGVVNLTQGTVQLDTVYRLPNMLPVQPRTPGSYSVGLLDSVGATLAEFPFTPHPIQEYHGAGGDELAAITELVPYHPNTVRIVVMREGLLVAERSVSPRAPRVTMISPRGGEVLDVVGSVHVEWQASDDDGDPLAFQVFFSADGGKSWLLAASRLTATQIDLPVGQLKGTDQGLFMVMASDGVNTGRAVTPMPFVVPRHAPEAVISPQEDFGTFSGEVVILSGLGLDREDGLLDNEALEWTSNRDGFLGSGSTLMTGLLSQGTHLIALTATDSDGEQGTASIRIDVAPVDTTPPVLMLPGNIIAEATSAAGAVVDFTATATDAVDGSVPVSCVPTSGSTFPLDSTVVNCSASDAAGNSSSGGFSISVRDTTQPVLTLRQTSFTVALPTPSATGVAVNVLAVSGAQATDAVDVSVSISHDGPATFPLGATVVTIIATDDAGNASQRQFTVNVVYTFGGFMPPVNNGNSIFRTGRTIPVRFQLLAADGEPITEATPTLHVFRIIDPVLGTVEEIAPDAAGSSNSDNFFRYDAASRQYIYNLKTTGYTKGTYLLRAAPGDGTQRDAQISILEIAGPRGLSARATPRRLFGLNC